MNILKLKNTIQNYKWGTTDFIPDLLNLENSENLPCAELWLGAHSKAPSRIASQNMNLKQLITKFPNETLGDNIFREYGRNLPFLLKVLSAETPLSIQAHPNKKQAEIGFAHEIETGKASVAFDRNYKDDNHKPELICALTPFTAMCGFRPLEKINQILDDFLMNSILPDYSSLNEDENELKLFFSNLMNADKKQQKDWIAKLNANLKIIKQSNNYKLEIHWIKQLQHFYPGDIGVLSPLLLNLIELNPGEALYLNSGILHAYLQGSGIEIMANSDNVLRGGLTPKHIAVPELLKVLNFSGKVIEKIEPIQNINHERTYQTAAQEFELSIIDLNDDKIQIKKKGPEILFCSAGKSVLHSQEPMNLNQGESVFIPDKVFEFSISGKAKIFRAKVPT